MSAPAVVMVILAAAGCGAGVVGATAQFSFRGSGQMQEQDVKEALFAELAANDSHLPKLEEMFKSFPKNAHGNLGHQVVRYALHRYFVDQHGWFIRGLEPNSNESSSPAPSTTISKEWVPSYLQELLEKRSGQAGANIHDLVAMALALKDLVRKEARARLTTAYEALELSTAEGIPDIDAKGVLSTYYVSFLLANNFSVASKSELLRKKRVFAKKYKGYDEADAWLQDIINRRFSASKAHSFETLSEAAYEIGEEYHSFNDHDCQSLRSTLRGMEGRRAGRVRLSTFYNMSLYSHWRFTEKAEYLKALGALDESDPKQPSVIISNYVMARPNCLDASNIYAICCRNTCEDLMGHVERQIGTPTASPGRIVELVSALPSESVSAPRELQAGLVRRLHDVAAQNGGSVPLHGRLFAQWMHHAYPLECPYPHEAGSTNPQTPDEWLRESGHTDESASTEEMQRHVESDTCGVDWKGRVECAEENTELPWSNKEELLTTHPHHRGEASTSEPSGESSHALLTQVVVISLAILSIAKLFIAALNQHLAGGAAHWGDEAGEAKLLAGNSRTPWAVLLLMVLAYEVDLLDAVVFAFAVGGGLVMYAFSWVLARINAPDDGMKLPLTATAGKSV